MNTICRTYSGMFDPFSPCIEDIAVEDIAHQLAMHPRYGGAVPCFYSVAQHAVRVAHLVERISGDSLAALLALHHDSAEAYIGDQRSPIKRALHVATDDGLVPFSAFEFRILNTILRSFGLPSATDPEQRERWDLVDAADASMLRIELRGLFGEACDPTDLEKMIRAVDRPEISHTECMSWQIAKGVFLGHHKRLMKAVKAERT